MNYKNKDNKLRLYYYVYTRFMDTYKYNSAQVIMHKDR